MQLLRVGNFGRFPGGTICRKEYVLVKILRTSREPLNPEDSKVHKRTQKLHIPKGVKWPCMAIAQEIVVVYISLFQRRILGCLNSRGKKKADGAATLTPSVGCLAPSRLLLCGCSLSPSFQPLRRSKPLAIEIDALPVFSLVGLQTRTYAGSSSYTVFISQMSPNSIS